MKIIGVAGPLNLQILKNNNVNLLSQNVPDGLGGTVLPPLIIEFMKRGQKIVVFTLDYDISETILLKGDLINIYISPIRKKHRARDFFALERKLILSNLRQSNIDIIHAHWTYEFALSALYSGIPALVTAHDAPLRILRYDCSPYRFIRTMMAYEVIKKSQNMTAVSPYISLHLKKVFKYNNNLVVIPNGISQEVFSQYKKKENINGKKVIFAAVLNGWGRLKNASTLIKAFSVIREKLKFTELWLFGIGYGINEKAEHWAQEHKMTSDVRFIGRIEHQAMLQLLSSEVDILVHPSLEESFSMVIVEALALGIPVIGGSNSGAVLSTLDYGKAGNLVDVSSVERVAEVMLKVANDKNARNQLAESGRVYAMDHYKIEKVATMYNQQYVKLYK